MLKFHILPIFVFELPNPFSSTGSQKTYIKFKAHGLTSCMFCSAKLYYLSLTSLIRLKKLIMPILRYDILTKAEKILQPLFRKNQKHFNFLLLKSEMSRALNSDWFPRNYMNAKMHLVLVTDLHHKRQYSSLQPTCFIASQIVTMVCFF